MQTSREKMNDHLTDRLGSLRNQFLAHVDMTRTDSRIQISELKGILDIMCKEFNNVCSVIDDQRVSGISNITIGLQDMDYQSELIML